MNTEAPADTDINSDVAAPVPAFLAPIRVSRSELRRIVVAIDPAVTVSEDSDETGIVVVARGPHQPLTCKFEERCPGHGYVLADYTLKASPHGWARQAIQAFDEWEADRIVAEVNNGGDMVGETIHAVRLGVPYRAVRASRGKLTRAEPVAALYEQGRMHHCAPLPQLEDQMIMWTGEGNSPDRLDALVWGVTDLQLIGAQGAAFLSQWQTELDSPTPTDNNVTSILDRRRPTHHRGANSGATHSQEHPAHGTRNPSIGFEQYQAIPYQVRCKTPDGRHRFFGDPPQCVKCGCDSPIQLIEPTTPTQGET